MYCQFHWIVHSDCPFVLCIVLSVSLDRPFGIAPSSCVLYCQFHWIVHSGLPLRPVYCTVSFTGSSIRDCPFVLCIVLSVSLDRPFGIAPSSCVLYCQFHWIVHSGLPLRPVYCTVSFTGLSLRDCPFVLCIHWIVHSGLPLRPVYCTVSFTGSSIRDCPFVLCIVLSVCQFHWIVHSGLPLRPVYCTVSFTGSSIRDCPFVLCIVLSVSLDCPFRIAPSSCVLYCQFHGIVHSGLPLRPVYCTVSFTGLGIVHSGSSPCPFVLSIVLSVSLDRPFEITPSSCVLYCQFHWIVHSGLPLRPVYCTVSFTGSSIRDCPFVLCIVLSVSLDCPFGIAPSSCVLYCQAHWIVHSGLPLRPVYCTVSFTGSSIRDCPFVLCIVLSVRIVHGIVHSGLPLRPVYCFVSFTGLSIPDCPFVLCIVLSVSRDRPFGIAHFVLCIVLSVLLDCPFGIAPSSCVFEITPCTVSFTWIVHSGLPFRPVYCTVGIVSLDPVSIRSIIAPSSCVLYCQFHWIVHSGLPLRPVYCTVSFTGLPLRPYSFWIVHSLRPVYCTVSFTGSSIRDCPFVLCIVLSVSLDCPFGIAPSSCVLYCLDRPFTGSSIHWIGLRLPLRPVYCTVSFTGLSIRDCPFVLCIVLSVSLDRPFGPFVLCIVLCQFHWDSGLPLLLSIPDCPFVL